MSSPFVGQIMIFAGNSAPPGWALCNGQLLSVAENEQLFNLIGTTYGGDHSMFAVPDLRGRVPIGQGQGRGRQPYQIGQTVGSESVQLTTAQLPPHGHIVSAVDGPGNCNIPAGDTLLSSLGGQAASGEFRDPGLCSARQRDGAASKFGRHERRQSAARQQAALPGVQFLHRSVGRVSDPPTARAGKTHECIHRADRHLRLQLRACSAGRSARAR